MAQLIEELFARHLGNEYLVQGDDGARLPVVFGRLVLASDSHVVSPLFFLGGDIGCLSVHGTINDVAAMGARPLYLAADFILEEGFPLADLARIVESMAQASRRADVPIVTGDTKVVERDIVHQRYSSCPQLTVVENVMLGPEFLGRWRRRREFRRIRRGKFVTRQRGALY